MNTARRPETDISSLDAIKSIDVVANDSILDKKKWHEAVDVAVAQSQVSGNQLAIIFIDVNHFKDVNDKLGHLAGDEVIASIRDILATSLRTTQERLPEDRDLLSVSEAKSPELPRHLRKMDFQPGHIGGDEFGILCNTDEKGASILVKRLRKIFTDYVENNKDERLKDLDISLAIGVSVLQPGMISSDLLYLADQDMYEDKIRQLSPLNEAQRKFLNDLAEGLKEHELRLRDVGKYLLMLADKN